MKRIFRLAFTLMGILTIVISGLVAILGQRPAPPFYVTYTVREGGGQVIYYSRIDGEEVRALTAPHQNSWSPVWSPDGNRLVVLSDDDRTNMRLIMFDTQRRVTSSILAHQQHILSPCWSPDGEWIVFSAFRGGQHSIVRVNIHTRRLQQITDERGNDFHPTWSPDGQWIAFVSDGDDQEFGNNDIYRVRIDAFSNLEPERLTYTSSGSKHSLKWSPNGEYIAFISRDDHVRQSLQTLHVPTGQVRELTNVYAPIQDWQLNWSNDGEWLYVLKDVNGERIWHRIQVDGENLRAVPNYEGFHSAAWSPAKEQNRMRLLISLVVGLAACSSILLVNFLPLFRRRSQKEKGIKVADPALTTSV